MSRRDRRNQEAEPVSSIACRPQIESTLAFLSQHLGVGPRLACGWDRTGGQEFPLLQNGDWSAANLFGRSGRFDLSVQGAPGLAVSAAGFAYRIVGEDVLIDPDTLTFQGLAARLGPAAGNLGRHCRINLGRGLVDVVPPDDQPFVPGADHADKTHTDAADVGSGLHDPIKHAGPVGHVF